MANRNCFCALSVIKEQCERNVFDCRRCYHKMKNTGKVFELTTADNAKMKHLTTTISNFPAFTSKLYWDITNTNVFTTAPEGVTFADIRCASGIWKTQDAFFGNITDQTDISTLTEGVSQLGASLYFEGLWRLAIRILRYYPPAGGAKGYVANVWGHYDSEEDNCFITTPATFTFTESAKSVDFIGSGTEPIDVADISSEFPATAEFIHKDKDTFDPVIP